MYNNILKDTGKQVESKKEIHDGDIIKFNNKDYRIEIVVDKRSCLKKNDDTIEIHVKLKDVNDYEFIKRVFDRYKKILNKSNKKSLKEESMPIKYISKTPTADEFNNLTEAVGWGRRDNKIVEEALNNTLYSLCAYDGDKLIGYGRIIGDKTMFLYIHDVMVIPEYQGKQIGIGIMKELLKQIDEYKKVNLNIRTYLGASKGKEKFYEKFGFISRPNEDVGAGMILYNK